MVFFARSVLALLLLATGNFAAAQEGAVPGDIPLEGVAPPKSVKVTVEATFPQSEIFGVKLVNGHPTNAVVTFNNGEANPITIVGIAGALVSLSNSPEVVRNLTLKRYGAEIAGGDKASFTYPFTTDLHPQDLRLQLTAILSDKASAVYTLSAYNGTVSVVEAPMSVFDPQLIFLYLVLAGAFAGTCYFIYITWISTLFPQQKKRSSKDATPRRPKKAEDAASPDGVEGATATGSKAIDQSWLPAHHLQRPEAKRVASGRSSTPKTKARP